MRTSLETNEISAALVLAQGALGGVHKDSDNPFFKSRYASFAACRKEAREPLAKNGLAVVQGSLSNPDLGLVGVETRLVHKSSQWFETDTWARPKDAAPQNVAAAISYLRRIGYSAMLGLVSDDDDDGNSTQQTKSAGIKSAVDSVLAGQRARKMPIFDRESMLDEEALVKKFRDNNVPEGRWLEIIEAFHGKPWDQLRAVVTSIL